MLDNNNVFQFDKMNHKVLFSHSYTLICSLFGAQTASDQYSISLQLYNLNITRKSFVKN